MSNFKRFLEIVVDMTDLHDDDHWERWERFHDGWESFGSNDEDGADFDGGLAFGELRLAERF